MYFVLCLWDTECSVRLRMCLYVGCEVSLTPCSFPHDCCGFTATHWVVVMIDITWTYVVAYCVCWQANKHIRLRTFQNQQKINSASNSTALERDTNISAYIMFLNAVWSANSPAVIADRFAFTVHLRQVATIIRSS